MANDPTTFNNSNLAVGAMGSAAGLLLGIFGTLFISGNVVSTQIYTTSRVINNTIAYEVWTNTGSTATGGLKSGGAGNYLAINIPSPMSATLAPLNGLTAGTGTITGVYLDPLVTGAGTVTCSVDQVSLRGTGGTLLINKRIFATGAVMVNLTGSVSIGPTQSFRCSVNPAPSASFNVKTLLRITPSQATN